MIRATATQEAMSISTAAELEAAVIRADARREAEETVRRARAELDAALEIEASVDRGRRPS